MKGNFEVPERSLPGGRRSSPATTGISAISKAKRVRALLLGSCKGFSKGLVYTCGHLDCTGCIRA